MFKLFFKVEPKLKVVGTLEHPQQWKVFLYSSNVGEKGQALNKSKIGDIVWFCLSEEQVNKEIILILSFKI